MKRTGHGPVMLNLRMEKSGGGSASLKERENALEHLIDRGRVPRGWKMAAISWQNPKSGTGWKRGGSADLDKFLPILRSVGLSGLRMAQVETVDRRRPSAAFLKKANKELWRLESRLRKAERKWKQALKARDRSRLPETKQKWQKRIKRAVGPRNEILLRMDKLRARMFPELREYEIAVDYRKGRRR